MAGDLLSRWRIEEAQVLQVGHGVVEPVTTVVRIRLGSGRSR
jgi:hypothetical protein